MADMITVARKPAHEVIVERIQKNWAVLRKFSDFDGYYRDFHRDLELLDAADIPADQVPHVLHAVWEMHQWAAESGGRGVTQMLAEALYCSFQRLANHQTECNQKGLLATEAMFTPPT